MSRVDLEKLLGLVKRKQKIDHGSTWSDGSSTYIDELRKEITEVQAEIGRQRQVYLEDELADVLWDYLNLVSCLAEEEGISIEGILAHALAKYEERISGIEEGRAWKQTKSDQKIRLQEEHRLREVDV